MIEHPFDAAQGMPFDAAQGMPFDAAQAKPCYAMKSTASAMPKLQARGAKYPNDLSLNPDIRPRNESFLREPPDNKAIGCAGRHFMRLSLVRFAAGFVRIAHQ